ncbi:MAG: carbon-nitrogen hydrolase family protein [Desulfitobacteriaceae bacterium]|nr:carbon-nitrogen hydrolase family protein [Clostridia bacterium]MDD4346632.1 carbon-nitrogen hydrolase family protein [Desulfitobacteriaceae bacterium]
MRIAFLHLDLSGGPEKRNLDLLGKTIGLAAGQGANWIVTPEVAVQGYFFAQGETAVTIPVQPDQSLQPIRQLAAQHKLTVFLGCAEQDAKNGKYYNSCLVIGPEGNVLGSHRKTRSHGVGAEAWVTAGDKLEPVDCPEMKAGIMVCADSWFVDKAKVLKDKGAEVLTVLAAWPPGHYGPGDCWERCSQVSGLPVWVCNQTGKQETLDFSQAQSVVVADGKTQFSYSGSEAVLLFDWDCSNNCAASRQFTVVTPD